MQLLCGIRLFMALFPQICEPNDSTNKLELPDIVTPLLTSLPSVNISLPDTAKNPFLYLEQHNYHYENHTITTEDGYILLTVRIPYGKKRSLGKKRPPVIFLHGIFCSFYDFLNAGPEKAIGFQILEEGYDLWLMNSRGNTYSKKHVTLDPVLNASAFWNFSWHELGYYDVAANMDYIENITGFSNVSVVGHSQGGTVYLALAASRPEYDRRITFSFQLAPVGYLRNAKQLIVRTLRDNLDVFEGLTEKYHFNEIFPRHEMYTQIGNALCNPHSPYAEMCTTFLLFLGGPSDQQNSSLLPVLTVDHPAGASLKQVIHYIQVAISDKFQLYDYGPKDNKAVYNQEKPPLYNLSAITSPVAIYYGKSDYFVSVIDGRRLAAEIPNALHFLLGRDTNHLDVQWGTKAVENVFQPGIKLLNKYNKMRNVP